MKTKIISPQNGVMFDDESLKVRFNTITGVVEILPQHENFIAIMKDTDLVVQTKDSEISYFVKEGVARIDSGECFLLLHSYDER